MKKYLVGACALFLTLSFSSVAMANEQPSSLYVNGYTISSDVSPIVSNNRIMVPFRALGEALGCQVTWDNNEQKAIFQRDDVHIAVKPNEKTALVNGVPFIMDTAPVAYQGRVMVPVQFIADKLGMAVNWDSETNRVDISNYEWDISQGDVILQFSTDVANVENYLRVSEKFEPDRTDSLYDRSSLAFTKTICEGMSANTYRGYIGESNSENVYEAWWEATPTQAYIQNEDFYSGSKDLVRETINRGDLVNKGMIVNTLSGIEKEIQNNKVCEKYQWYNGMEKETYTIYKGLLSSESLVNMKMYPFNMLKVAYDPLTQSKFEAKVDSKGKLVELRISQTVRGILDSQTCADYGLAHKEYWFNLASVIQVK